MTRTTLLILGASGDLTSRLLLPALAQLLERQPELELDLVGAGTDDWSTERWRAVVRDAFETMGRGSGAHRIADTTYARADVTRADDLRRLIEPVDGALVVYFALPPAVAEKACGAMRDIELAEVPQTHSPVNVRVRAVLFYRSP